jgi:hypothetical protein
MSVPGCKRSLKVGERDEKGEGGRGGGIDVGWERLFEVGCVSEKAPGPNWSINGWCW